MAWITNCHGDLINLDLVKCIEIDIEHESVVCHFIGESEVEIDKEFGGYDFRYLFSGDFAGSATEYMEYLRQKLT